MRRTRDAKTVLVTGAGGSVGSYVVGLAEAAGYRVIASDLAAAGLRKPVRGEIRVADLTDDRGLSRLVAGCDAVIHTAALLDGSASTAALSRVNAEAVAKLFEAAEGGGVGRFVHMSTAMLYAPEGGALHEDAPLAPRGPHGLSKHGAEIYLRGRGEGSPLAWTIVRAAPIYGRRGRHFASGLLALGPMLRLAAPWLPRLEGGPSITMTHAEDVARALLFLLERDDARYRVFNVGDDDAIRLGERLTFTFEAYGLRLGPTVPLHAAVLEALVRIARAPLVHEGTDAVGLALWRLVVLRHGLKPALRPHLDSEGLSLFQSDLVVDTARIRALGFRSRFPRFTEGFREVLRWYQAERWVPRYA